MKHTMLATAAAALMALAPMAEAQDLKMSHVRPQGATIDVELKAFAEAVDKSTGGCRSALSPIWRATGSRLARFTAPVAWCAR